MPKSLAFLALLPFSAFGQGLPRARPEDVGMSASVLERIGPAMQSLVDSGRFSGIATAVARHGKVVYQNAVGTMDSARAEPLRIDAVFRIYSMTKPVTTVAIMQLYDRGKLKLDDPVAKYIPEFATTRVFVSGSAADATLRVPDRPITIAHLLTHTSGLTYGVFGNTPVDSMYQRAGILRETQTIDTMAARVAKLPLLFQPGTRWNYSVALDVLGRVVEVVSGKTFDKYLATEVFAPLQMNMTSFHATPAMTGRITTVFSPVRGGQLRAGSPLLGVGYRDEGRAYLGGQGLLSTIPDYLRFAQMLLNGGELDGKRLLKRETVALMMKNELPAELTPIPGQRDYGFGYGGAVRVDSTTGTPEGIGTFQWAGYASTYFWIDPKNDVIGLAWAQLIPSNAAMVAPFQKIVYSAITRTQTPTPEGTILDETIPPGANFDKANFRLWYPANVATLRGVVVLMPGSNGDGRPQAQDTLWQQFAAKHQLALLAVQLTDKPHEQNFIEEYIIVSRGSGQAMLDALASFSSKSNHPELAAAPFLMWGMSAGGQFNYEFVAWKPERVIAFVVNKGGIYYSALLPKASREVPGMLFVGGKDLAFRTNTIAGLFAVNRRAGALWAYAEEPSAAHIIGRSRDVATVFFEDMLTARLGSGATLQPLTEKSGLIGDLQAKTFAPMGDRAPSVPTAWLPTERVARAWQALVLEKPQQ